MKTFTCRECGAVVQRTRKTRRAAFCSRNCALNYTHKHNIRPKTITCANCGKEHSTPNYKRQRYCSNQCAVEARTNPMYCECKICGKIFKTFRCKTDYNVYCSMECKHKGQSLEMRRHKHPMWRGGKTKYRGPNWGSQRYATLKRDGYKCAICHEKYRKGAANLGVHHIKPYREFNGDWEAANRLSNLITLCRDCHVKVEYHAYPCPQCML